MKSVISDLNGLETALHQLGYEPKVLTNAVALMLGANTAVLSFYDDPGPKLDITVDLVHLADIDPEQRQDFAMTALAANHNLKPYALAIIVDDEDPEDEEKWVVVLTDSLTIGDLSLGELHDAMTSLESKIGLAREVFQQ